MQREKRPTGPCEDTPSHSPPDHRITHLPPRYLDRERRSSGRRRGGFGGVRVRSWWMRARRIRRRHLRRKRATVLEGLTWCLRVSSCLGCGTWCVSPVVVVSGRVLVLSRRMIFSTPLRELGPLYIVLCMGDTLRTMKNYEEHEQYIFAGIHMHIYR